MILHSLNFIFFGTDEFSVIVLEELKKAGFIPRLIVTAPDRPKGRGLKLTPPPVKIWAQKNNIQFLQPEKLDASVASQLSNVNCQLFVVASYGKIIPKEILDISEHGALNVHPSLLPLYRGASPIQSQILDEAVNVGVTIMFMDEKMDHGPILAQQELGFKISDLGFKKVRDELAKLGGQLLAKTIPKWINGEIKPREQDHTKTTYTKKITKEDGLINLDDDPELNYRKFLAYSDWPSVYFLRSDLDAVKGPTLKRIKITDAELRSGLEPRPDLEFVIKKIIPEGKKEMPYKKS